MQLISLVVQALKCIIKNYVESCSMGLTMQIAIYMCANEGHTGHCSLITHSYVLLVDGI